MNVLICGGRNVGRASSTGSDAASEIARATQERNFVNEFLNDFHAKTPIALVIGGEEGGAERMGLQWARVNNVSVDVWERRMPSGNRYLLKAANKIVGRSISPLETTIQRNIRMLAGSTPNLVMAFGSGESTAALLNEAKSKGIEILEVKLPEF